MQAAVVVIESHARATIVAVARVAAFAAHGTPNPPAFAAVDAPIATVPQQPMRK